MVSVNRDRDPPPDRNTGISLPYQASQFWSAASQIFVEAKFQSALSLAVKPASFAVLSSGPAALNSVNTQSVTAFNCASVAFAGSSFRIAGAGMVCPPFNVQASTMS